MLEDQLLDVANDSGLKNMFGTTSNLYVFLIKVKVEYTIEIAKKAQKSLLPFSTSYLCKAGFFYSDGNQKENVE